MALWQMVTVALAASSSIAIGLPTMLLRPMTTACLPRRSKPIDSSIFMQPYGVQGRKPGVRHQRAGAGRRGSRRRPCRGDRLDHLLLSMCFGSGSLHQDAVDLGVGVERVDARQQLGLGRCRPDSCSSSERMPASLAGVDLVAHVDRLAGSSPTRMTARPGR